MGPVSRVYVARLARMLVLGPLGENFGRVRDVVISISIVRQQPRVLGLIVDLATRRSIFIPILRVAAIEPNAVTLNTGNVSLRHFEQRPGEVLAIGQVLDTPVKVNDPELPELAGLDVVITDLGIEQTRTRDWMVSRVAVRGQRRLGRRGPVHVVNWQSVQGRPRPHWRCRVRGWPSCWSNSTGEKQSMWPTPSAHCRPSGATRC
jgi:Mg/Co/Ni transporter MgtE